MPEEPTVIPDKIYFKIGEVGELVGVQAHVLRYWETEFSTLSPQKNKSGQRSYRRRDVEIAMRIKQLLYNEMFTIAGARKKLQSEIREASRPKEQKPAAPVAIGPTGAPLLFDAGFDTAEENKNDMVTSTASDEAASRAFSNDQKEALRTLAGHLLDLREMLRDSRVS